MTKEDENKVSRFVLSLDFELFWGMQDHMELSQYEDNVIGGRKAIPALLKLFQKYDIHATWAVVGFVFASGYSSVLPFFPSEELLPSYSNERITPYNCFSKIGATENEAPCYFGSSLVKEISATRGQEIGSHTFSHYYCEEDGQTVEQFLADVRAAKEFASSEGYDVNTMVLPRNQCVKEYTKVLTEAGYIAYRGEENDWVHKKTLFLPEIVRRILRLVDVYFPITGYGGYIPQNEDGIWNIEGSRMYKPFLKPLCFMEKLKIIRIKRQMKHCAKKGLVFHLWFHPHNIGVKTEFHLKQLEEIFSYYLELNKEYGMKSMNMQELVEELNEKRQDYNESR